MSYLALYRKWRPSDFDQVKGQDAIVRTLRNQIIYDRIGHAYLFCGTRGTGKTSIAKLFAKAVNCENPADGNPCGICSSCRTIADQTSMDVIEIDAASNNGVDNIRQIREQVQYRPTDGRYKIYIIDEVHMLSPGAFNALLKTLEEPPSYVIFILATTEKHKIPVTILSRCQQYDFRRISVETITSHLADLMAKESIEAETRGLAFVARMADGSMRDALSLLDPCIAFYPGQALTYDKVVDVLGAADISIYASLLQAISSRRLDQVMNLIDQVIMEGRELGRFLNDFLWHLRNLLLLKDAEDKQTSDQSRDTSSEIVLDVSAENIERMKQEASRISTGSLLYMIRTLSDLASQVRYATQKRVILEVGFIKLCRPDMEAGPDALLARIERLEEDIASQAALQAARPYLSAPVSASGDSPGRGAAQAVSAPGESAGEDPPDPDQILEERFSPAQAEDLRRIAASWRKIVSSISYPMKDHLSQATIAVAQDSDVLLLLFDADNIKSDNAILFFEKNNHENLDLLSEIVAEKTGKKAAFRCVKESPAQRKQESFIDLTRIHFDHIEIEDAQDS